MAGSDARGGHSRVSSRAVHGYYGRPLAHAHGRRVDDPDRSSPIRTLWAYSFEHYSLSAATPQSRILMGDYDACAAAGGERNRFPCRRGWGSPHPGGLNFILCDGSGTFLNTSIDMNLFADLATIAGGEPSIAVKPLIAYNLSHLCGEYLRCDFSPVVSCWDWPLVAAPRNRRSNCRSPNSSSIRPIRPGLARRSNSTGILARGSWRACGSAQRASRGGSRWLLRR